jgi:hypothetical protein
MDDGALVDRLRAIEEELRDLAYDALRARVDDDTGAADRAEKRYERARRAVERAIAALSDVETDTG